MCLCEQGYFFCGTNCLNEILEVLWIYLSIILDYYTSVTIILIIVEPRENRKYRIRNTSFSVQICWSNVAKYLYFSLKNLNFDKTRRKKYCWRNFFQPEKFYVISNQDVPCTCSDGHFVVSSTEVLTNYRYLPISSGYYMTSGEGIVIFPNL